MTIAGVVVLQLLLMRAAGRLKVKINTPPLSSYKEGEMSIFIHPNDLHSLNAGIPTLLRNKDITTFLSKIALASSTAETAAVAIGATHALATEGASKTKKKIIDKILWRDDESSVLARETHLMVKDLHDHFCGLGLKLKTKGTGKNGNGANGKSNGEKKNGNGGNANGDGHSSADNGGNGGNGGSGGGLLDQLAEMVKEIGGSA